MELRLQLQARATKDTDIIVIPADGVSIVDALRDTLTEPYLDFAFRLANVRAIGNTPASSTRSANDPAATSPRRSKGR